MLDVDFVEEEEYEIDIYADIERNLRSYSGFISLLRELIQNSDDSSINEKDVEVEVHFLKDKLVLKNNTAFNDNDWNKIKKIGSRNKEENSQKTGRFGIGFTSVFKICDTLNIHSRNVSRNLDLNRVNTGKKWRKYTLEKTKYTHEEEVTEFEFFWRTQDSEARRQINAELISPDKIKVFVDEVLKNILNDIHFLNHISKLAVYKEETLIHEIRIKKETSFLSEDIIKEIKTINFDGREKRILLYHKNLSKLFSNEFEKKIARRKPFLLSVAFGSYNLQKGRVFCTLPTEMRTGFAFDINCDFQPDQNRKQLIFDEDDDKGKYNLKIFSFIPDLLYEILDDLKNEISVELFYEVLSYSEKTGQFSCLYEDLIDLIRNGDLAVIYINDSWYSISETRFLYDRKLLNFLSRIDYPIIPEMHLGFSRLFELLGVETFGLDNFVDLIKEKIPQSIEFSSSIFDSIDELYDVYSFIENSFETIYRDKIKSLNLFLTKDSLLQSNQNSSIVKLPKTLGLIKNDLPVIQIDENLASKFGSLLYKLEVFELTDLHIVKILTDDFASAHFPIRLSEAKPYINSKEKLLLIISFIEDCFDNYNDYLEAKKEGAWFSNGELVSLKDKRFKKFESSIKNIFDLPFVLSEDSYLYPLKNNVIYDLNSECKQNFANLVGFRKLDEDIKKVLHKLDLVPYLDLAIIIDYFESYLDDHDKVIDDGYLILLYQLVAESKAQLDNKNITRLREIPIFRNTKNELCSLDTDGKEMMLLGDYPVPEGIQIDDLNILDETLLNNVPGYPNFKKQILESELSVKRLTFELFILHYFIDIFSSSVIRDEDKLRLVDKLNIEYHDLESKDSFPETQNVLLKSNLVFCNDGNFHCPSKETIYFRCKEFDDLFGSKNYLYPDCNNISKYEYMFDQLGVNRTLDEDRIINYILSLVDSASVNKGLIERIKKIFVYINTNWEQFDNVHKFSKLANIEWLPASGYVSKLYEPSDLYLQNSDETQNTKPFLTEFSDILYLDITDTLLRESSNSSRLKRDFVRIIGLNNVQKIPTEKIIENLELLSEQNKSIKNPITIYSELDKRAGNSSVSVSKLHEFKSIYIKYEDEKKPRYFSTSDVFKGNHGKKYGYEYIGYLPLDYVSKCNSLIESLNILDEPNAISIKNILKMIELKCSNSDYLVTSENDIKIISNCLKELNNIVNDYDFKFNIIQGLQQMRILCNKENRLISPEYAILDDNSIISIQFEKQLGDRFVKYSTDYLALFKKLEIKKISQIVSKELVSIPNPAFLRVNKEFTNKLKHFARLIPRIKFANEESAMNSADWRDIDPDLEVYEFDNLEVLKYVAMNGDRYIAKENNAACYITADEETIQEVYVKGSHDEILYGLTSELFETIHPSLDINFISTIHSLFQKSTYEEMDSYLTNFLHCPVLEDKKDTLLEIEKKAEIYQEDSVEDNYVENEHTIISGVFEEQEDITESQNGFFESENQSEYTNVADSYEINESAIDPLLTEEIDDSQEVTGVNLGYGSSCQVKSISKKSENQKETRNIADSYARNETAVNPLLTEEIDDSEELISVDLGVGSSCNVRSLHKKSQGHPQMNKGRIKNPNEKTDFSIEIEKQYNHNDEKSALHVEAIDKDLEPMSLEDEEKFNRAIRQEISSEIRSVGFDSKNRDYKYHLERIKEDPSLKLEVKDFYKGKCQICNFTFRTKNGDNHCIITSFLEKRYGGIRHPANYLCLCPSHSALLKYGTIKGLDRTNLASIKNNEIVFTAGTSKFTIKYNPFHFKMLKQFLKSAGN